MAHRTMSIKVALALAVAFVVISPGSALAKAGGSDRPVKGGGSGGTVSFNPQTGQYVGDTSGTASQLGKYSLHFEGTAVPSGENTYVGTGTATFVAANGDRLTGTVTSISEFNSDGTSTHTVIVEITGGTGRFADASGTVKAICLGDPPVQVEELLVSEIECELEGTLS
jgi:hypothetical protein